MDVLNQVGEILLKGLPTFVLVLLLYIFLQKVFFRPLGHVLAKRRALTQGAREQAAEMLRKAEEKTAEYEKALQNARAEVGRDNERERRKLQEAAADKVKQARAEADRQVREAGERLVTEVTAAKETLVSQSDVLAEQVIRLVVGPEVV